MRTVTGSAAHFGVYSADLGLTAQSSAAYRVL